MHCAGTHRQQHVGGLGHFGQLFLRRRHPVLVGVQMVGVQHGQAAFRQKLPHGGPRRPVGVFVADNGGHAEAPAGDKPRQAADGPGLNENILDGNLVGAAAGTGFGKQADINVHNVGSSFNISLHFTNLKKRKNKSFVLF